MNWQRERDGLVVVGLAAVVVVAVVTGNGGGMVATFVAAFLGVLAALRVDDSGTDDSGTTESSEAPTPPAGVDPGPRAEELD